MFSFVKNYLNTIYTNITEKLQGLWTRTTIDEQLFSELEKILIQADIGVKTTARLLASLKQQAQQGAITAGADLKEALKKLLLDELAACPAYNESPIYLLVGVNGSGKTTFAAKLAQYHQQQGKRVLMVAADTFRAAAPEQLATWAAMTHTDIERGIAGADPASVVFTGCQRFVQEGYDILIIDTAGRLQTKINLMKELAKIQRVINKALPTKRITTLLAIDAMLGQNSYEQARLFHESTTLDGIVLTKMDGTGKGGIVLGIAHEINVPIAYICYGEEPDRLKKFDAQEYVASLLS